MEFVSAGRYCRLGRIVYVVFGTDGKRGTAENADRNQRVVWANKESFLRQGVRIPISLTLQKIREVWYTDRE